MYTGKGDGGRAKRGGKDKRRKGGGKDGDRHSGFTKLLPVVAEHVLGQHHTRGPQLPTTPGLQILVQLYRLIEET